MIALFLLGPAVVCYLARYSYPRLSKLCGATVAVQVIAGLLIYIFSP